MDDDRALLEAAARAAGYEVVGWDHAWPVVKGDRFGTGQTRWIWMPLDDDGDALRLAVKVGLSPSVFVGGASEGCTMVSSTTLPHGELFIEEMHGLDPYAATRRAIVRAAAAMAEGTYKPAPSSDLPEDNYYKTMGEAMDGGKG